MGRLIPNPSSARAGPGVGAAVVGVLGPWPRRAARRRRGRGPADGSHERGGERAHSRARVDAEPRANAGPETPRRPGHLTGGNQSLEAVAVKAERT